MLQLPFVNRAAAGRLLAQALATKGYERPVVYALPRGGVPVALEVAQKLKAPLDLLLVRKIGVPGHEELAAGSIVDGEKPDIIVNANVMKAAHMSEAQFEAAAQAALKEIERRRILYMADQPPAPAKDCTAILIDDGVATGASMRAAIEAVRRRGPRRVVVAVPVAARDSAIEFAELADDFVCLAAPANFGAVGYYYEDFRQLEDADVITLMKRARAQLSARATEAE
jgi:putative phosphoribosyl transferase